MAAGYTRGIGAWLASSARCLAVVLLAVAGRAQASGSLGAPPSPAEQCLAPALAERAKPEYPATMLEIKRGALVHARFTFVSPDEAPRVALSNAADDFGAAIRQYARQLRVPCMAPGASPVTILQDFDFVPNDGRKVAWTLPLDEVASARNAGSDCDIDVAGPGVPPVAYPPKLLQARLEGNAVVGLHFFDPAQPPEMTVLADGGSAEFVRAIRPSVQALRLACLGKDPINLRVFYKFQIDGTANRKVLRDDLRLDQLLGVSRPLPTQPVYFDTRLMKCPFDVRLTVRQPWNRNRIDELDEDVESRHALLGWLSTLELHLPARDLNRVLGQSTVVHVPCIVIDL